MHFVLLAVLLGPTGQAVPADAAAVVVETPFEAEGLRGKPLAPYLSRGPGGADVLPVRFRARVSPGREHFLFTLRPGPADCRQDGPACVAALIDVAPPGGSVQTLRVVSHSGGVNAVDFFEALDVDFDGHLDLRLIQEFASKWSAYQYWIFQPESGRYERTPAARDLSSIRAARVEPDAGRRRIVVDHFHGACFPNRYEYAVSGRGLRLVDSWELEPSDQGCLEAHTGIRPRRAPLAAGR